MIKRPFLRIVVISLVAWVAAFVLALKLGSAGNVDLAIVVHLRLPRAVLASAIGMALAVSGAVLQALFSNPLAEPYTLGISSGAALGAVVGASLGLELSWGGLAGSGFMGAIIFVLVLYLISFRTSAGNLTLLLAGVMLGFLGSSLVALWMAVSDSNGVQAAMLWLMGNLSRARLSGSLFTLATVLFLSVMIQSSARKLDALLLGEESALALGVDVAPLRRRLIIMVSLMIGAGVSAGGMIGFVGLVVPHFVRKLSGSLHRRLLPLCAIWGATSLTVADVLARIVLRPYELPVGVVTAIVGAPLFLWVMLSRKEAR